MLYHNIIYHYHYVYYVRRRINDRIHEEEKILSDLLRSQKQVELATREAQLRQQNAVLMAEEAEEDLKLIQQQSLTTTALDTPQVPQFLQVMMSTITTRRRGRDYMRCPRYPNIIVMTAIEIMVNCNLAASQVPRALRSTWKPWLQSPQVKSYMNGRTLRVPGRVACNKFRRMIIWMVRAQIGMEMTKAYWRCKQDAQVRLVVA